jgi:predicted RNA binding protein YcfA (HicA-like mRNA interferase family)
LTRPTAANPNKKDRNHGTAKKEVNATPTIPEGKTTRTELEAAGWIFSAQTGGGQTFKSPDKKTMIKLSAQGFVTKLFG